MEHILLGLAEFVLVLGGIGIFLMVLFLLGLGAACWGICKMFPNKAAKKKRQKKERSEVESLRQRLLDAQTTAYESAVASEKAIQELQRRLYALEAERGPGFVSLRR